MPTGKWSPLVVKEHDVPYYADTFTKEILSSNGIRMKDETLKKWIKMAGKNRVTGSFCF